MTDVRRNALLLALGLVFLSGMIQLAVALGTVTIVAVTGVQSILGLGPAVFLVAGALAVGPAGRLSDRIGRMPVIRAGYILGIAGPLVTAAGCNWRLGVLVFLGLGLCGAAQSIVLLSRAAAAEMFPPERRARGMSIVLFGVVSGAIWGPLVFGPHVLGAELRRARPHRAVARRRSLHAGRARCLVRRAPRSTRHVTGVRRLRRAPRPLPRDPSPARRRDRAGRGRQQLRRDGRRDEPRRVRRRRPSPCAGQRVHDHQHPHRRHVRARACSWATRSSASGGGGRW